MKCPKCGSEMMGGAPHGPWRIQMECHRCGYIYTAIQIKSGKVVPHV